MRCILPAFLLIVSIMTAHAASFRGITPLLLSPFNGPAVNVPVPQSWIASFRTLQTPTNLMAEFNSSSHETVLKWEGTNLEGYQIERKSGTNGAWNVIATVSSGTNSYTDTEITYTNFIYRVRASNLAGGSTLSNDALVNTFCPFLFQNSTTGDLQVWFADGTHLASSNAIATSVSLAGWRAVCLKDLDNDQRADVLLQRTNGQVGLLHLFGADAGNLSLLNGGQAVNKAWSLVGAADYNNDGQADLVWKHRAGYVSVWFMNATNLVRSKLMLGGGSLPVGWDISGIGVFPHDKLGHGMDTTSPDFLLQNGNGKLVAWYMHGLTFARGQRLGSLLFDWRAVATADLNHDSEMDVIAQQPTGHCAVWQLSGLSELGVLLFDAMSPGSQWRLVGLYP